MATESTSKPSATAKKKAASSSAATVFRTPPHSGEAERCLLGGLMIDNNRWESINEIVMESDFYYNEHQLIFRSIQQLAEKNQSFDVVTVAEKLKDMGALDEAGKIEYLGELTLVVASADNIMTYAFIIRDKFLLRRLIEEINDIAIHAYEPGEMSSEEVVSQAEAKVFSISENRGQSEGPRRAGAFAATVVEQLEKFYKQGSEITGLSTGFDELDQITTGLHPGELIVVAGRPSMGKTSLAMNLVESTVIHGGKAALVFSMEMASDQIIMRMFSSIGRISQQKLRKGEMTENDWGSINNIIEQLDSMDLYIDDGQSLSPSDLRSRSRRVVKQLPEGVELGIIMVDYIQLMQVGRGGTENRVAEISEITRNLKGLAKEMRVPVIALSQLNRSVESRVEKRPIMADLRESGSIEQDADLIMFIYRDEVYNKETTEQGVAEIIISKQRNGPTGTIKLGFEGEFTRFVNSSAAITSQFPSDMKTVGEYAL